LGAMASAQNRLFVTQTKEICRRVAQLRELFRQWGSDLVGDKMLPGAGIAGEYCFASSVFVGEHDGEDAGGLRRIARVFAPVFHRALVVDFPEEAPAAELERAEVMLAVPSAATNSFSGPGTTDGGRRACEANATNCKR
jgi:hypothetical protein